MSMTDPLPAILAIRKLFLMATKAFDVADIMGERCHKRDAMRALHERGISLTDGVTGSSDLIKIMRELESLLLEMTQLAGS